MTSASQSFPLNSNSGQYMNDSPPLALAMSAYQPSTIIYATKKLENMNCIQESTANFGALYLGDIISVLKPDFIQNHKIAAILTCISETNYPLNVPSNVTQKTIAAKDTLDYPINVHFVEGFDFIENMRKQNKNILVHCHAGVSRSAAIVCAYLMKKKLIPSHEALSLIKQKRPRVRPNQNFLKLLKNYELQLQLKSRNQNNWNEEENYKKMKQFVGQDIKNQIRSNTEKPSINFRNSLDSQSDSRFLKASSSFNQLQNSIYSSRRSANNLFEVTSSNPAQRQSVHYSPLKNQTLLNCNLKQKEPKIKLGLSKTNNSASNNNEKTKRQRNQKQDGFKKEELTFGQQFKNKISLLLGRKTRIPWELSKKNIDIETQSISIGCI